MRFRLKIDPSLPCVNDLAAVAASGSGGCRRRDSADGVLRRGPGQEYVRDTHLFQLGDVLRRDDPADEHADAFHATLAELGVAARGTANLMPPIIEAARAYATVGEMCDVLREVFGEYQEQPIF